MSNKTSEAEIPGIAGAIADLNKRFARAGQKYTCPFVPGANYHICHACGKSRDEHLAKEVTSDV